MYRAEKDETRSDKMLKYQNICFHHTADKNLPNHNFEVLMLILGGVIDILIWRSGLSSCTTGEKKQMTQCWNMLEPTADQQKNDPLLQFPLHITGSKHCCPLIWLQRISKPPPKRKCIIIIIHMFFQGESPKNSPTKMWTELASSCKMPANKLVPNSLPAMFDQSSVPPAA